ncbi:hypothetical protein [Ramlibacter pallidus]|uniref:Lipoprotein n=1 Tax=Ramlibacter pallidus TaxID=2780087 RepID=A0ABR9S4B0_9BURK|nr:hypothetical protein [Ramlibacter pallidus]MBE7368351.1 hypothetical protein [Ramlibacter pallidus]
MRYRGVLVLAAMVALSGCGDELPKSAGVNNTAVLGGYAPGQARTPEGQVLTDGRGQPIPPAPVPAGVQAQAVRSAEEGALAVWVQEGHVVASGWTRDGGWTPPQALEEIYGVASDPQVAGNGRGSAMAVWRHTVGSIHSLRFSRFDTASGWSVPDVMPGALPRPDVSGPGDPTVPRLQMDAEGNVVAQWPSGFAADEVQTARYLAGQGWSAASSERMAANPAAPLAR